MSDYFSDREGRIPPRPTEQIRDEVWAGVRALTPASVGRNCFAESYPNTFPMAEARPSTQHDSTSQKIS